MISETELQKNGTMNTAAIFRAATDVSEADSGSNSRTNFTIERLPTSFHPARGSTSLVSFRLKTPRWKIDRSVSPAPLTAAAIHEVRVFAKV